MLPLFQPKSLYLFFPYEENLVEKKNLTKFYILVAGTGTLFRQNEAIRAAKGGGGHCSLQDVSWRWAQPPPAGCRAGTPCSPSPANGITIYN